MDRNVDKIKRLNYELGRRDKKIADQGRQLAALTQERDGLRSGLAEIAQAVDALCLDVALKYGAQVGAAAWEARLPKAGPDLLQQYTLDTCRDGEEYVLRATGKESTDDR